MISIENYTVREVLMKNRTRVWRNVYNTASAWQERYYKYFAKHKWDFSLILREQVSFPINIILLHISMLNLTVFVNEVLSTICFAIFSKKYFQVCHFLFKETFSNTSIHPSKVFEPLCEHFCQKTAEFFNISK